MAKDYAKNWVSAEERIMDEISNGGEDNKKSPEERLTKEQLAYAKKMGIKLSKPKVNIPEGFEELFSS